MKIFSFVTPSKLNAFDKANYNTNHSKQRFSDLLFEASLYSNYPKTATFPKITIRHLNCTNDNNNYYSTTINTTTTNNNDI